MPGTPQKLNDRGFAHILVIFAVLIALIIGIFTAFSSISSMEQRKDVTQLDKGGTVQVRHEAFAKACMEKSRNNPYGGTFMPIDHISDPSYGGGACFRIIETNGEFDKIDMGLFFPNKKSETLKSGFYKGSCSNIKDLIYRLNDTRYGSSLTALDIDMSAFRGNTDQKSGWPVLAVFGSDSSKPVACLQVNF